MKKNTPTPSEATSAQDASQVKPNTTSQSSNSTAASSAPPASTGTPIAQVPVAKVPASEVADEKLSKAKDISKAPPKPLIPMWLNNFVWGTFTPDKVEKDMPIGAARLVWFSALALVTLLLWAAWAEIDQMARGLGQVVPSQRTQLIQNLEGGIVQDVLVREGQIVEKNAIVMRIENESAGSQYREALMRSLEYEANIARLDALINKNEPQYPEKVLQDPSLVKRQNELLRAANAQNTAELEVLTLRAETTHREVAELKEAKEQALASFALVEKQRNLALPALKAKAYSELQFLDIEQRLQTLKAEIARLEHSIPRVETAAKEADERVRLRQAELASTYRQQLNESQVQLHSLQELLTAGGDKVSRTEMRSPVKGIIKSILITTVGGVVAPGATVMEIVPLDDSLIIEARFSPADIAFLYPGQKARVRITAYDFSVYGGMEATVEHISADTLKDPQGFTYYQVKVRTENAHLEHDGEKLPIIAGMQAEVDVLTGKKSILDYLLKPLLKTQQRAFREK